MKQSGFWDSAPVGGAARTQNGKEAEERRTGEERQGPGKRNRGRVRKAESQRQEEGGGRCDELDGRISQRHSILMGEEWKKIINNVCTIRQRILCISLSPERPPPHSRLAGHATAPEGNRHRSRSGHACSSGLLELRATRCQSSPPSTL